MYICNLYIDNMYIYNEFICVYIYYADYFVVIDNILYSSKLSYFSVF